MPPTNDDVTILVCDCGKRLKAPGARPGRVGVCPACGSTLRYPDAPIPAREAVAPKKAKPVVERPVELPSKKSKKSNGAIPVGAIAREIPAPSESQNPERAKPLDSDRRAALLDAARQVGRGGFFKLPRKSQFGLKDALLYPLWDFAGISWILFMPFALFLPYLAVFFLIPVVLQGGNIAVMGPLAFPMIIVLAVGLGYLGLIFSHVFVDSSCNEVHHPKWPEIEFGAIVGSLFRWCCGLAIGLSLGAVPAIQFWRRAEEHGLGDRMVAAILVSTGLLYGLMSLACLILHDELLALNPWMVVKAIFRAGRPYLQTVVLAIVVVVIGVLAVEMVNRCNGGFSLLPAAWLMWAIITYGGIVVSRSLGMAINTKSKQIGWFPDRPRWGASMDGIDPTIFRDKDGRRVS